MKFYIVDVFAEQKYQGNQLAVFIPDKSLQTDEMQKIAREMNFSETTFVMSGKQENGGYDIRIFTPDFEIPFAGHPTLGTAFIIHKFMEKEKSDKVLLNMEVGTIPVHIGANGLMMEQNQPSFDSMIENRKTVSDVLKINEEDIRTDYPIQIVSTGLPCIVTPLTSADALRRCAIDHSLFKSFLENTCECNLLVFASDKKGRISENDGVAHKNDRISDNDDTAYKKDDIMVRVFMDNEGYREDPATGSANGNLAAYLLKYNYFNKSKIKYNVHQGSEISRPSLIRIEAEMQHGTYKINVGGKVFLVASGEWG